MRAWAAPPQPARRQALEGGTETGRRRLGRSPEVLAWSRTVHLAPPTWAELRAMAGRSGGAPRARARFWRELATGGKFGSLLSRAMWWGRDPCGKYLRRRPDRARLRPGQSWERGRGGVLLPPAGGLPDDYVGSVLRGLWQVAGRGRGRDAPRGTVQLRPGLEPCLCRAAHRDRPDRRHQSAAARPARNSSMAGTGRQEETRCP